MHDDDEEKTAGAIKITDRRRFDSSGNARPEDAANANSQSNNNATASNPKSAASSAPREASGSSSAQSGNASTATASRTPPQAVANATVEDADEDLESEINFSSFVVSLATQALMQMGQMSPPPGVNIETDLTAAKQTIDILQMLQNKTRGNLTTKETEMLTEILHSLKMGFVRSRGGQVGR